MVVLFISACAVMGAVVVFADHQMNKYAQRVTVCLMGLILMSAVWMKFRDPLVVENHVIHDKTIVHEETVVHEETIVHEVDANLLPPKPIMEADLCAGYYEKLKSGKDIASQYGQDIVLYQIFKDSPSGHFMDLAACWPKRLSNTYLLETCMGWTGICIEADPRKLPAIVRDRTCRVIPDCVTQNHTEVTFGSKSVVGTNGIHNDSNRAGSFKLTCHPLDYLLKKHGSPKVIDYMSLDIEGSEDGAMLTLGDDYRIETFTLELYHLRKDAEKMKVVRWFLDKHDYVPVIGFPTDKRNVCASTQNGNHIFDISLDVLLGEKFRTSANHYQTHDVLFVRRDSKYFDHIKKLYGCASDP